MRQVANGVFAVEESMPCNPRDIEIPHYVLPATLGRVEQEEAAARVLSFSQELNQWVGVSWPRLVEMMQKDYELGQKVQGARDHNLNEKCRVERARQWYRLFCVLTLGIYALFAKKPTAQMREVTDELPFTGIFLMGPRIVIAGIRELFEKGMLKVMTDGEGENAIDVIFPTPALVACVMKKQGVA